MAAHIKERERETEEDWQQMLAQSGSSPAKKEGKKRSVLTTSIHIEIMYYKEVP